MKLTLLYENLSSGAIAIRPAALGSKSAPIRKDINKKQKNEDRWYLKFSKMPKTHLNERI